MTPTIYTIPACNMPNLTAKLDALSRKSQKLIGKDIKLTVLEEVRTPRTRDFGGRLVAVKDAEGNQVFNLSYKVTIDAEVPKINGWSFMATIDHSPESGNIVRVSPNVDFDVPKIYHTIGPKCDHCQINRERHDTFLLRSDATGAVKQIGRSCLRDFLGHDIKTMLAMAELVYHATPRDNEDDEDWGGIIGKHARYIYVPTFVAHASAIIRHAGYVRKADGDFGQTSTADATHENMFRRPGGNFKPCEVTDKDLAIADLALAWGASLADSRNDYEHNLSVVARETMIANRSTGILASLVSSYMRHVKKTFEQAQTGVTGSYVGTLNDRLRDLSVVLYGYQVLSGGQYGPQHIYRFLTDAGDLVVWFASHSAAKDLGLGTFEATNRLRVKLTGTVSKQQIYNGVKQTIVKRCAIARES